MSNFWKVFLHHYKPLGSQYFPLFGACLGLVLTHRHLAVTAVGMLHPHTLDSPAGRGTVWGERSYRYTARPRLRIMPTPSSSGSDIPLSARTRQVALQRLLKNTATTWRRCCEHICLGEAVCKWPACWSTSQVLAAITTPEKERLWETLTLFQDGQGRSAPMDSFCRHSKSFFRTVVPHGWFCTFHISQAIHKDK